jgi:hypothetical protein
MRSVPDRSQAPAARREVIAAETALGPEPMVAAVSVEFEAPILLR